MLVIATTLAMENLEKLIVELKTRNISQYFSMAIDRTKRQEKKKKKGSTFVSMSRKCPQIQNKTVQPWVI